MKNHIVLVNVMCVIISALVTIITFTEYVVTHDLHLEGPRVKSWGRLS